MFSYSGSIVKLLLGGFILLAEEAFMFIGLYLPVN